MRNAKYNARSCPVVGRACSPLLFAQEFYRWKASAYFFTVFVVLSCSIINSVPVSHRMHASNRLVPLKIDTADKTSHRCQGLSQIYCEPLVGVVLLTDFKPLTGVIPLTGDIPLTGVHASRRLCVLPLTGISVTHHMCLHVLYKWFCYILLSWMTQPNLQGKDSV